ncbi:MAG: immunoglobulin domain-containing protein [Sphingobacteriales bacterium JAD_PAG50586_3]|nr:MAG: immunoglobulin domain-containing protein [Sphingobacteriales bacterium JAD_PAG50586_3]
MKKVVLSILTIVTIFVAFGYVNQSAHGNGGGAPAGRTGSPGDGGPSQSCARSGCHTGGSNPISGSTNASLTSTIPTTGYIPGQTYTVTGFVQGTGLQEFGFQISPQNTAGTQRGTLVVTDASATQIVNTKYITHRTAGTAGSGSRTWSFNWVAPAAGTGAFSFYGAFNATNSNNNVTGDIIYLEELLIAEAAQISTQPTNQSACTGANASFTISATGTGITYQWKKNGSILTNDGHFSGVTTNTLTITNVNAGDVDSYTCEVTGSGNTIASNPATFSLLTPASISDNPNPLILCGGNRQHLALLQLALTLLTNGNVIM